MNRCDKRGLFWTQRELKMKDLFRIFRLKKGIILSEFHHSPIITTLDTEDIEEIVYWQTDTHWRLDRAWSLYTSLVIEYFIKTILTEDKENFNSVFYTMPFLKLINIRVKTWMDRQTDKWVNDCLYSSLIICH